MAGALIMVAMFIKLFYRLPLTINVIPCLKFPYASAHQNLFPFYVGGHMTYPCYNAETTWRLAGH